jgi:speckle-type POZ protein
MSGTPKMIVPYEWILENVGEEPMTILSSKMISFRGEKVFRVGLKNTVEWPFLFFVAINLNKMGMKVKDVKYGIQGSDIGPATMLQMKKEDVDESNECLQLFTTRLDKKIVGNCTFAFRICIEEISLRYYSYQLCDRLAKDQLWAALYNQQNLVDVELIVQNQKIYAHKAILAARSPVFSAEFEKIQLVKDGHHRIWIDGVKPSTVMKYLHFIYTGEPMGTFADEELLKLANKYRVLSLYNLCLVAMWKIERDDATYTTRLIEGIIDIEGIINGDEEVSRGVKSSKILYGWDDDWTTTVM